MEKPILFKDEMVRAILDGRKTQTRRVIKIQPPDDTYKLWASNGKYHWVKTRNGFPVACENQPYFSKPYYVGDRLWVRETWAKDIPGCPGGISYRADHQDPAGDGPDTMLWKPSIFMPRWASRITLEVTDIKVERVQDISDDDALAEGVDRTNTSIHGYATQRFRDLWDSVNKKRGTGWAANPFCWVISFKGFS